jgi:hypothetical protein
MDVKLIYLETTNISLKIAAESTIGVEELQDCRVRTALSLGSCSGSAATSSSLSATASTCRSARSVM